MSNNEIEGDLDDFFAFTRRADGDLVFGSTIVTGADVFMDFSEGAAVLSLTETGK